MKYTIQSSSFWQQATRIPDKNILDEILATNYNNTNWAKIFDATSTLLKQKGNPRFKEKNPFTPDVKVAIFLHRISIQGEFDWDKNAVTHCYNECKKKALANPFARFTSNKLELPGVYGLALALYAIPEEELPKGLIFSFRQEEYSYIVPSNPGYVNEGPVLTYLDTTHKHKKIVPELLSKGSIIPDKKEVYFITVH